MSDVAHHYYFGINHAIWINFFVVCSIQIILFRTNAEWWDLVVPKQESPLVPVITSSFLEFYLIAHKNKKGERKKAPHMKG